MTGKPTQLPDWAVNEAIGGGEVTEPPSDVKNNGWAAPTTKKRPVRSWDNWFKKITGALAKFNLERLQSLRAILPGNGAVHSGLDNSPSTGTGFGITSGDFDGVVFHDGYMVGPIDSPPHTYTANRDTYFYLSGVDGSWGFTEVNNGDPIPTPPANSYLVWKVVTDGTGRTSFNYPQGSVNAEPAVGNVKTGLLRLSEIVTSYIAKRILSSGSASDIMRLHENTGTLFNPVDVLRAKVWFGLDDIQSGSTNPSVFIALNAELTGSTWSQTNASNQSWLIAVSDVGFRVYRKNAGSANWVGSQWTSSFFVSSSGISLEANIFRFNAKTIVRGYSPYQALAIDESVWLDPSSATGDPATDQHNRSYSGSGGSGQDLILPLDLPDAAIITAASWAGSVPTGDVRIYVIRSAYGTSGANSTSLMNTAPGYDVFDSASHSAVSKRSLTLDASEAIRTVDNKTYCYSLVVRPNANPTNVLLKGFELQYTKDQVE